jgi:hypothetical protein
MYMKYHFSQNRKKFMWHTIRILVCNVKLEDEFFKPKIFYSELDKMQLWHEYRLQCFGSWFRSDRLTI